MHTLEEIWTEYRAVLKGFLHKRVSDPDDVEDLLQEILIKTHRSLPTLAESDNLKAWLFRVARNATIDHYRRTGRTGIHPEDLWYGEDDPEIRVDLEACVAPFIAGLPVAQGALLTEIDINGISQKDYAAREGISYSTLKSRVQSARKDLRGLYDNCCELTLDAQGRVSDYTPKSGRCDGC